VASVEAEGRSLTNEDTIKTGSDPSLVATPFVEKECKGRTCRSSRAIRLQRVLIVDKVHVTTIVSGAANHKINPFKRCGDMVSSTLLREFENLARVVVRALRLQVLYQQSCKHTILVSPTCSLSAIGRDLDKEKSEM
jgi:hypothetical protein